MMDLLRGVVDVLLGIPEAIATGNGFLIALVSYVGMILIERLGYLFERGERRWHERDAIANVLNQSVTGLFDGLIGGAIFAGVYLLIQTHLSLFEIPFVWWAFALTFLLNDLAYYVDHRIAHRTGFFWAFHIPHHSSNEMNLTVAARGSIFSLGGTLSPAYFVLALIGIPLAMFAVVKFFANLWGIFNHTRLVKRMGFLEGVLATPANHRVHHGTEAKYLDKNYGQVLILWDRLFGTWQPEEEEPTYGLVQPLTSYRVIDIQTQGVRWLWGQLRKAPTWRDRLMYLIKPPGWSHTGEHETSEVLIARAAQRPEGEAAAINSRQSEPGPLRA